MTPSAPPLREATCRVDAHHIIHDPNCLSEPSPAHFDADHWLAEGRATPMGEGRGSAWLLHAQAGDWVLRRYRRGGLPGKLIRDRYWHWSTALSRPWREFRITARLHADGLAVPRPIAACLTRHGLVDTGALITACIPDAVSLGEAMRTRTDSVDDWQAIGRLIAQLHAAGVWHADLNIANLLADTHRQWHVIDLDRARLRTGRGWQAGNLARLRRSIDKLHSQHPDVAMDETRWTAMLDAYTAAA